MPIICGWLWNPVLGTKPKRQVFCIGTYNSEIWMETCRLNWYVSHPLIIASTSISIWVIPHSNVTNIFPEVPKIQGLIVKMKISLDYSANTKQALHSVLSHRKQGQKASLISWNKFSNCWTNVHCRYNNRKYLTGWAQKSSSSSYLQWMCKKQMQDNLKIWTGQEVSHSLLNKSWL